MSGEFISALDAEIANLERELEQDVRYIRLRELKKILRFYGNATSSLSATLTKAQEVLPEQKQARSSVRQPSPAREKGLTAAREYIGGLGRIVPTRELLEHLVKIGIEVGGASPLNNLSAMISTSGAFQSHGRRGWTILEQRADADPRDPDMMREDQIMRNAKAETERPVAEDPRLNDTVLPHRSAAG